MGYNYAVVVVTYNRLGLLKECLGHILRQTVKPGNVVVVDNASTDGTSDYLDGNFSTDPLFTIVHSKKNEGGAGGFYEGLKAVMLTDSEWFMLIDDDAILFYDCMEKLMPDVSRQSVMAYACTVTNNGKIQTNHRKTGSGPVRKDKYKEKEISCKFASFCGLMISRSLVWKIGYPEKDYFIRFDDTEYCMRITKYCDIVLRTDARLEHKSTEDVPWSIKNIADWKKYYGVRNSIHAYKKHKKYFMLINTVIKYIIIMIIKKFMSFYDRRYRHEVSLYGNALIDGMAGRLGRDKRY